MLGFLVFAYMYMYLINLLNAGGSGVRHYDGPDLKLFIVVGLDWSSLFSHMQSVDFLMTGLSY